MATETQGKNGGQKNGGLSARLGNMDAGTGAVLGAAAVGLAAGLAANLGRKAVKQGVMTASHGDWASALAAEHAQLLKLFDQMEATGPEDERKRSTILAAMKMALLKHSVQEENTVYPALRDAGEVSGADELNHEHGYVKQYLYDLEMMDKASPEFLPTVAKFRADIEDHMREEENDLYPRLRAKLSDAENRKLTLAMNKEGFKVA